MRRTGLLAVCFVFVTVAQLPAADSIQPGAIELYPTPAAVGIEARYTGDDNQNATASFRWRKRGEEAWRHGVEPTIDRQRRLMWASIWPLVEGDRIEVEWTCRDAEAGELAALKSEAVLPKLLTETVGGRDLYVATNLRIHGNRIRNAHTAISLAPVERGPLYCTRNDASFRGLMFKLNVAGCTSLGWAYCYHNSGYCLMTGSEGGTAISFPPGIPCTNKAFKNNALIGNEWSVRAGRKGYVLDANCYWHTPGKTPRRFQWEQKIFNTLDDFRRATQQEQHGQYADPLFVAVPGLGKFTFGKEFLLTRLADDPLTPDARAGDLHLQAGSPCIDRGTMVRGINDDYRGQAPDIGAFER